MNARTVRELGGEIAAELTYAARDARGRAADPFARFDWRLQDSVVQVAMGVLARHAGAVLRGGSGMQPQPRPRRYPAPEGFDPAGPFPSGGSRGTADLRTITREIAEALSHWARKAAPDDPRASLDGPLQATVVSVILGTLARYQGAQISIDPGMPVEPLPAPPARRDA